MPSLQDYNTFGIDVNAAELHIIESALQLENFSFKSTDEYFILGGGSNMLLVGDIEVPVLKNEIKGIEILNESDDFVELEIGGGENWHETVLWAIQHNYGGIENLSLIPGTVGASPIQNIGAYGTEVKDVIIGVTAFDMLKNEFRYFNNEECEFSYRNSFFKKEENKGRFFISSVKFRLHKDIYNINSTYGPIKGEIENKSLTNPSISDISNIVISIRQSKLPDPQVIGNSGSFFKNPVVDKQILHKIKTVFDEVPYYPVDNDLVKIPAGWLIEQCGWKGKIVGNTGNYEKQALIIVNYGNATGEEIYNHACNVRDSVHNHFGIELEFEVNII